MGQLKSPNTMQSDRREIMVSSVQIRDMLSGSRVLGLRYAMAIVDGSVLKSRSHTIRLTQSEEGSWAGALAKYYK